MSHPPPEELLTVDGSWGRESQLFFESVALVGQAHSSGWPYNHEDMNSVSWTVCSL